MDIHEYIGVLRRGVVLILIGVLAGLAGGYAAQSMERPSYSATSRELLTNKVAGELSISQGRIASYVLVASSGLVLQPVIDELQLDTSVGELAERVSVVAPPNTVVIEITATAATPTEAQETANAISRKFSEVVADQLETTTGAAPTVAPTPTPGATAPAPAPSPSTTKLPDGTVVAIAVPTAPVRVVNLEQAALPSQPNPSAGPLMLLVGGVLGLALGLVAASVREAFDRRIRTPRDVARVTGVPVIGAIVRDRRVRTTPLTARAGSRTPSAESFRAVRAHIDHLRERDGRRIFVLTGAGRRQGTTTVAANVALALANTGTSVVVVDADLRRPGLSAIFGLQSSPGLSGLLTGRSDLDAVLRGSGTSGLTVVPAGPPAVNAGELVATPMMRTVLAELARRFEVVIIDTPTIASASDAAVLGAMTGSTFLIVAQGATTRPRLDDALALLEAGGSEPIGIVLTRTRRALAGRSPQAAPAPMRETARAVDPVAARNVASDRAPLPEPVPAENVLPEPVLPQPVVADQVQPLAAPTQEPARPVSTAVAVRKSEPSHLAEPLRTPSAEPAAPRAPRTTPRRVTAPVAPSPAATATAPSATPVPTRAERTPRRVTQPATTTAPVPAPLAPPLPSAEKPAAEKPSVETPVKPATKKRAEKRAAPAAQKPAEPTAKKPAETPAEPASTPASRTSITDISHTLGKARDLDFAFAALPTATAAEQRAGTDVAGLEEADPELVERPIVIKPDAPRPSRFAPDPTRLPQRPSGAYAKAPAPLVGTEGMIREPEVVGTVVNTISIRVQREVLEAATVPPPIRHILPHPTASTIPPKAITAARTDERQAEPELVAVHPPADADQTRALPIGGSLLGEIGGLQRVEVRAARPAAVTDTAPNPERQARESYEQRARELERAAHDRLMREQQRLAVSIREQLAHDKRELESVLDNRLEDTVLHPVGLSPRRAADPRFSDPADDDGHTR